MRSIWVAALAVLLAAGAPAATAAVTDPASTVDGLSGHKGARTITYVGTLRDRSDLAVLGFGRTGHWFAHFGVTGAAWGQPTAANARDALPGWVAAFNHTEHPGDPGCTEQGALARGCTPTYNFRTFSQDGPARSATDPAWARLRLPGGECGTAGAIVDPHTYSAEQEYPDPTGLVSPRSGPPVPTTNNTMNRIQLQDGVPSSFFVGVVTDTTAGAYDPGRLEIRASVGLIDQREEVSDNQVEPSSAPGAADLAANGIADIHVFRVENFVTGDYLKLRLRGATAPASFAGLLFDTVFEPSEVAPPAVACD